MNSHQFEGVYKSLKINLDKLGCLMLDIKWPTGVGMWSVEEEGLGAELYHSKHKERFWIDGWVADKGHLTLLYGFLKPATKWKKYIMRVLKGWQFPELEIQGITHFESPYKDEPYYCIVAKIKVSPELMEGHQRLEFLPHINTFTGYKPHVTICYIKKDREILKTYLSWLNKLLAGKSIEITKLNFGGNK